MKKFIAALGPALWLIVLLWSVVFAPTVSAEISYHGTFKTGAYLMYQHIDPQVPGDDPLLSSTYDWEFSFGVYGETEKGGFSAGFGLLEVPNEWDYVYPFNIWVNMWWRPTIDILVKIGQLSEGPGIFSGYDLTGWGLDSTNINTKRQFYWWNGYAANSLWEGFGFYQNPGGSQNLLVQIAPLRWFGIYSASRLFVSFGFPLFGSDWQPVDWKESYIENLTAQVSYWFHGLGEAALSYVGNPYRNYNGRVAHDLYAHWRMNRWRMDWEFGVNYRITSPDFDTLEPIGIGIGWKKGNFWADDPLVLAARLAVSIPLEPAPYTTPSRGDTNLYFPMVGFDFTANYRLSDGFRFYLPVGASVIFDINDGPILGWQFSPYVVRRLGGPELYAGFHIINNIRDVWDNDIDGPSTSLTRDSAKTIRWAIPICLVWEL